MVDKVLNFAAGPAQLPVEVLEEAQKNLLNYKGCGQSVMEMSHRASEFMGIFAETKACFKRIMNISDDYEVLFLQGGASLQFSMVPMNLVSRGDKVLYIHSGHFSRRASEEAAKWADVKIAASSVDKNFTYIPKLKTEDIDQDAKYIHFTGNNTIYGTTYYELPPAGKVPLVADWSSAITGKQINVNDYELIYAGAQKNLGIAGLTIVIIKKELLDGRSCAEDVSAMLSYKVLADKDSMFNTPPCFAIYMAGLMFDWVEKNGGVLEMERRNCEKANLLYDFIDNSKLYTNSVNKTDRSITNVVFTLPSEQQTKDFIEYCKQNSIVNIKGHKLVGGCRASIYNAMPLDGVKKLIEVMKEFEKNV